MPRELLRQHAEQAFQSELEALQKVDTYPKPPSWHLSPWAVLQYVMGGELEDGTTITPKYIGSSRLMEIAIATLATDRALLLLGVPGTAKTWVSEHLAAAISGDSTLLIQGTAGTSEELLRYNWNYALLLSKGPSEEALVPSPVMKGMEQGKIVRVEELTRMPAEVQDSLITLLSEKVMPIPELNAEVQAVKGFNLIATANNRDQGVSELSAALRRRFNTVVLPLPATLEVEVEIVNTRVEAIGEALEIPQTESAQEEIKRLITIFRELREGKTLDGTARLKSPQATLSTAEAISVVTNSLSLAAHFGSGTLSSQDMAASLVGAIIKNPQQDTPIFQEYLETVVKERDGWDSLYRACKELL
ncbi:MAG: AAA family ATPase [Bacteroidota bacterium]